MSNIFSQKMRKYCTLLLTYEISIYLKILKIIPSENGTNTNRIFSIKFSSVRRHIKAAQIRPRCVVGMKIWRQSKPVIRWLRKMMFKEFMYKNGVFKCNVIMEFKDIKIIEKRVSMCFSS